MSQQCEYHPLIHLCIIYSVYVRDNLSLITVICYNLLTKSQSQSQLDEQVPGWHWHCRCRALEWTQLDRAHRTLAGLFTRSRSRPPPPGWACPPGAEPGGNWVQSSEYASLNQPNTPHFAPHSSLTHRLDAQGLKFNPFFGSPCRPISLPHCPMLRHDHQRLIWSGPRLSLPSSPANNTRSIGRHCTVQPSRLAAYPCPPQNAGKHKAPVLLPPATHPLPIFSSLGARSKKTDLTGFGHLDWK